VGVIDMARAHIAIAVVILLGSARARADEDEWPRAVIDRPLTLQHGLIEANIDGGLTRRRVLGVRLGEDDLVIGVRWGVTETVELDAATSIVSAPEAGWSGLIRASIAWRRIHTDDLDVVPTARLDGCGSCGFSVVSTAALGAPLRWRATRSIYVHAGRELLPVTIRPYLALDLSLRTGAGVQLTPWLAAEVDAELARVTVVGQWRDDRWLAHAPVSVSVLASIQPRVDLGLTIGADRAFDPADGWRAFVTVAGRSR
jgi:hypothetical protein